MGDSLLDAAFAHHAWATERLIDACSSLSAEQLATDVPDGFGSVLRTLQHVVGSDAFDLAIVAGKSLETADTKQMGLSELRAESEATARGWVAFLATAPAAAAMIREVDPDDGYQRDAPLGIRLVGALEHGMEHRGQISSGLKMLGIEPPRIGVFDFGLERGVVVEVYPEDGPPPPAP
ncbi:MAG TPA: DinB family protein [Tepidiformaceae bacterium]|nr:DinB family protein [Tepidiformaceae bacterium]